MKTSIRLNVIAVALLSSISVAAAMSTNSVSPQDRLSLTSKQQKTAWMDISKQAIKENPPAKFAAKIGAVVPGTLMTYPVPITTSSKIPVLRRYQYALLENNSLLIVNPNDKKIADVITH